MWFLWSLNSETKQESLVSFKKSAAFHGLDVLLCGETMVTGARLHFNKPAMAKTID